jgi:hypothetical protein
MGDLRSIKLIDRHAPPELAAILDQIIDRTALGDRGAERGRGMRAPTGDALPNVLDHIHGL